MKKLLVFFTFLVSIPLLSQNLTLNEVLAVRKMDLGDADEFLTNKGWMFIGANENENGNEVIYAYNKSNHDDTAESFIYYNYSDFNDIVLVSIQIVKPEKFKAYINQIKAWGGKMIKSYLEEGEIIKVYLGSTNTYVVRTSTQIDDYESTRTVQNISIIANDDLDEL